MVAEQKKCFEHSATLSDHSLGIFKARARLKDTGKRVGCLRQAWRDWTEEDRPELRERVEETPYFTQTGEVRKHELGGKQYNCKFSDNRADNDDVSGQDGRKAEGSGPEERRRPLTDSLGLAPSPTTNGPDALLSMLTFTQSWTDSCRIQRCFF